MVDKIIQRLTTPLSAPNKQLAKDFKKAGKLADSWGTQTRNAVNGATKVFAGFAAAGVLALGAVFANTSKTADELGKLSDQLGEAPERIRALGRAADLSGSSQEKMNKALADMNKRVGEARAGIGSALPFVKQLGLDHEKFFNLRPADQFAVIADNINELGTQQEKAAASNAFFGREGGKLLNVLKLGSEGLREIEQEVSDFGLALTRVDIAKIEAANDEFLRAKEVSQSFFNAFTTELAPIFGAISKEFSESAKEAGGLDKVARKTVESIVNGVGFIADAMNGLKIVYLGVKTVALSALSAPLVIIGELENAVISLLNKLPGVEVQGVLKDVSDAFVSEAVEAQEAFQAALLTPPPSEKIKTLVSKIMEDAQAEAEKVAEDRESNIGSSIAKNLLPANSANDEGDDAGSNPLGEFSLENKNNSLNLLTGFLTERNAVFSQFDTAKNAEVMALEEQLTFAKTKTERDRIKKEIEEKKRSLSNTKSFFSQGLSDLTQNSKKAFKIQKAMRIAEAVQNTYSAAMGAYNALSSIYIVGPALGAAAAAAAIAFGAQQISAIRSQSFGGGGSVSASIPSASSSFSGSSSAPSAQLPAVDNVEQQAVNGTTINFYGNISSNNTQQFAEDLKRLVDDGDFVLIESTSRNGLELSEAVA